MILKGLINYFSTVITICVCVSITNMKTVIHLIVIFVVALYIDFRDRTATQVDMLLIQLKMA